ncbi:MAG TPA: VPLPA-CTERM sorting domain-containing protein [Dongiaceae bacterium]|jgi:hypothetical protein|nr:VPLPA-CTERM sorting domain-containing protein [Dongiaceae bacterium]
MRLALTLCGAAFAAIASFSSAQATTLSGDLTSDNAFTAYISTNDNTLGTLVSSGTDWQNPSSLSTLLSSGTTYYLHIVATNAGGPDAFLGQFHLDDALHAFANGTQDLFTNVADWAASAVASGDPWSAPTAPVQSFGQNGDGSTIWSTTHGGPIAAIDPSAEWIWSVPDNGDAAFFSTKIVATTPIPASLPLLATALGGLGFMARRKRSARSA